MVNINGYYWLMMVNYQNWLVVAANPSEKYDESSVGSMKFPTEWKNNPNVPNHQPDIIS